MAKKIRRQLGDVVKIELEDDSFSFGRVLEEPLMAFYDCRSGRIPELEVITSKSVLFQIWVMNHSVESGRWQVIGNVPLGPEFGTPPRFFNQSPISKKFSIHFRGEETPSSREECEHLERAAVWDPEHVEDRLRDYYAGVPNRWVESLKPQ
jgi:hypothetical protein